MPIVVGCVACGAAVSASGGRPVVTTAGIALQCWTCEPEAPVAPPLPALGHEPSRKGFWPLVGALALSALIAPVLAPGGRVGGTALAGGLLGGRGDAREADHDEADAGIADAPLGPLPAHVVVAPSETPPASALGRAFES